MRGKGGGGLLRMGRVRGGGMKGLVEGGIFGMGRGEKRGGVREDWMSVHV